MKTIRETIESIIKSIEAEMIPSNLDLETLRGFTKYHQPYEPIDSMRLELHRELDAINDSFREISTILCEMEDYLDVLAE